MAAITIEKHVAAPPDQVFALATDFAGAPERVRGIVRLEVLTEGPVGVGTRFRETRVMFKKEASEEMEVTAFDPPRHYAVDAESHGCKYHTSFDFEPIGTGDGETGEGGAGTKVRMRFEAMPISTLAKLMSFMMKPMMKSVAKLCEQDLDDIKAAAEAGAAQGVGSSG